MKYRRRGFHEAQAEALRLAEAFVAANTTKGSTWVLECYQPEPDRRAPGFDRRKPIVKWSVWVKAKPRNGDIIDGGDSIILVDIETKEAHWSE